MTRTQEYAGSVPLLKGRWKEQPNGVSRNGVLYSYCPPHRVDDQMNVLIAMHNRHIRQRVPAEVQAAWLHHRFSQIHPFQDGNGRIGRSLASLVFIKAGLFPLVINRDEQYGRYVEALRKADYGDLRPLIAVFAEAQQMRFDRALNLADDLTQPAKTVELAVEAFKARRVASAAQVAAKQKKVFDTALMLQSAARERFEAVCDMLSPIEARVTESKEDTSHYYRQQVIEAARSCGYFANTTVYRSWVRLLIEGDSAAQMLLSFHGRGSEFAGVMVCAPVFELLFKPNGEGTPSERTQIVVTDRPFEFYFTERPDEVRRRFGAWLDETISLALAQLQRME
jgi:hypothetical protein